MYNGNISAAHYNRSVDPDIWQLLTKQVTRAIAQIMCFKTNLATEEQKQGLIVRMIMVRKNEKLSERYRVQLTYVLNQNSLKSLLNT